MKDIKLVVNNISCFAPTVITKAKRNEVVAAAWRVIGDEIRQMRAAKTSLIIRNYIARAVYYAIWYNALLHEEFASCADGSNTANLQWSSRAQPTEISASQFRALFDTLVESYRLQYTFPKDTAGAVADLASEVYNLHKKFSVGISSTLLKKFTKSELVSVVPKPQSRLYFHIVDYAILI